MYWVLEIETVTLSDAGEYMCEVENAVGRATATATLTVLMPPAWKTQPPADIRVQANGRQGLIVDCSATGTPPPHILWRREGIPLDEFSKYFITNIWISYTIHNYQVDCGMKCRLFRWDLILARYYCWNEFSIILFYFIWFLQFQLFLDLELNSVLLVLVNN